MLMTPFLWFQTVIKEGVLSKQNSSFQRSKRRYFKLRGRTLYYAKTAKVRCRAGTGGETHPGNCRGRLGVGSSSRQTSTPSARFQRVPSSSRVLVLLISGVSYFL